MNDIEIRLIEATDIELRAEADKPPKLAGYAALYNVRSKDLGGFTEVLTPTAFRDTLNGSRDVLALFSHDPDKLLGRTGNNTLRLASDERGLRVEIDVPDVTYGRDALELVKRKDIRGMSFGFKVRPGGEKFTSEAGKTVRMLTAIDLYEVSVVAQPAYPNNSLAVRVDPAVLQRAGENSARPNFAKCMASYRMSLVKG